MSRPPPTADFYDEPPTVLNRIQDERVEEEIQRIVRESRYLSQKKKNDSSRLSWDEYKERIRFQQDLEAQDEDVNAAHRRKLDKERSKRMKEFKKRRSMKGSMYPTLPSMLKKDKKKKGKKEKKEKKEKKDKKDKKDNKDKKAKKKKSKKKKSSSSSSSSASSSSSSSSSSSDAGEKKKKRPRKEEAEGKESNKQEEPAQLPVREEKDATPPTSGQPAEAQQSAEREPTVPVAPAEEHSEIKAPVAPECGDDISPGATAEIRAE
eukprot:TRINITY_DN11792_c0_g3_i1.p1 TRINITY_DN11792_c0_g3~~TRINITY_DN11792_c0_g3_i1.p1  ORF type:complete len:264 (-),score=76.49 TRINITY_DN11792_c0_g3_i1:16-807(-)